MTTPKRPTRYGAAILAGGPLWVEAARRVEENSGRIATLEGRIATIEGAMTGTSAKLSDIKLAVVGDLVGGRWQPGLREQIEHVEDKVDELKANTAQSMKEFERQVNEALAKAQSFAWLARWAVGVLTAIFVGLVTEMGNNAFGWYGAAKLAHTLASHGGH